MSGRWEIKDRENPAARGMRFASLERAARELAHAVPRSRWFLWDRLERREVGYRSPTDRRPVDELGEATDRQENKP
jgi:hypothetical protein